MSGRGRHCPGSVPCPRGDGDLVLVPGAGLSAPVPGQVDLGSTEVMSPLSAVDGPPMQRSRHISLLPKPLTKMGFDEVSAQSSPSMSPCLSLWLHPSMAKPATGFG